MVLHLSLRVASGRTPPQACVKVFKVAMVEKTESLKDLGGCISYVQQRGLSTCNFSRSPWQE